MNTLKIDRRAAPEVGSTSGFPQKKDIVKQGIRLQASLGTIGATEYLKSSSIDRAVIIRVLSGGRLRNEDRDAWAEAHVAV